MSVSTIRGVGDATITANTARYNGVAESDRERIRLAADLNGNETVYPAVYGNDVRGNYYDNFRADDTTGQITNPVDDDTENHNVGA